ncbi:MaoC-like dehydratase [Haloarcula tailed virus 2]|uniref:MaoC-like dehydratase n=1 Tax=Haloarcula tailed virus 2 TaxID=2877989 RepID=A0AAE8XZ05_9CAUD|nr:MaoC-like dehydratase [Haloarcula tailed virus 2]UBF23250.1 MaoC-like dehydratase [Haloarcula tailed virus 2]
MNKSNVEVPERRGIEIKNITRADVNLFAQMTGDFNDVHMSNSKAKDAGFDSAIIHGVLVEGVLSSAINDLAHDDETVILVSKQTEYLAPAYVGSKVRARAEIKRVSEGINRVQFSVTADDTVVIDGTADILFR